MSKKNVEWEWKKLGDVCSQINGLWKGKKPPFTKVGVIRNTNFTKDCLLDLSPEKLEILDVEAKQYSTRKLFPGDLIIEKSGGSEKQPVGRAVLFEEKKGEYSFSNFTSVLRIKDSKFLNCHFLQKQLYSLYLDGITRPMQSATIGLHNLDFDKYKQIDIAVPPLDEQERIVKVLDDAFEKIDAIKTTAETNLQNAKDLFQTTLKKLFSEISKDNHELLKNVAIDFSRGKSKHRPRNDKKLFGGNYPFIQTGDIRNSGKYLIEYTDTYNEFGLSQSKLWPKGTLCITIAANIAETTILTIPCCFPDSVIGFIPNEKRTTVDYVFYVLQFFKSELQILGKGAAQDNLNLATFEKMTFPFPPLSIQKQIVAKLDSLSEKVKQLESNYKQVLADCDELKKALLKQAFEGML